MVDIKREPKRDFDRMSIHVLLNSEDQPYRPRSAYSSPRASSQGSDDSKPLTENAELQSEPSPRPHPAYPTSPNSRRPLSLSRPPSASSHRSDRPRREHRPTYTLEEEDYIWYLRDDLFTDWAVIREAYNAKFPGRLRKGYQGFQCKYYRHTAAEGVPAIRERHKAPQPKNRYGLVFNSDRRYDWMRPEHRARSYPPTAAERDGGEG